MVALHCGSPQNLCSGVAEPSAGRSVAVAMQSLGRATTLSEKDIFLLPAPEERLSNSCAAGTLGMLSSLNLPGSVRRPVTAETPLLWKKAVCSHCYVP